MVQNYRSAQCEIIGTMAIDIAPTTVAQATRGVNQLRSLHPDLAGTLHTLSSLVVPDGVDDGQFAVGQTQDEGPMGKLFRIDRL